jgi:hypothetical protein
LVVAEPTRPLVACAAPTTPSRAAPVRSMTAVLTPAARTASASRLGAVGKRERGLHRLALRDLARQLGRARDERRDAAAASADDTMAMVGECECE